MTTRPEPSRSLVIAGYAAVVGLWILAGWAMFELHGSLLDISLALRVNPWVSIAYRQLAFPILGLAWLIFIFWLEWSMRRRLRAGGLWPHLGRAAAGVLAVAALGNVIRAIL
jgi:hypothetical protein